MMRIGYILIIAFLAAQSFAIWCDTRDDWHAFAKYYEEDKKGLAINCNDLINTKAEVKRPGKTFRWTEGILDYMQEFEPEFNSCKNELQMAVNNYCDGFNHAKEAEDYVRQITSIRYEYFCHSNLSDSIKTIAYRYSLLGGANNILNLEDNGILVNPKLINKISFTKNDEDEVVFWDINIHLKDGAIHSLYYGEKDKYENALADLSSLWTNTVLTEHKTLSFGD